MAKEREHGAPTMLLLEQRTWRRYEIASFGSLVVRSDRFRMLE
jgi:hypothetical protein